MFSDFPNLHPLVVHFPIVLILLGAGLQVLLVFKDWQQVRWGTLVIMGAGFAGALAASTIFHAMPEGLSPKALEVFNDHEKYSAYTLWLSGITFLLRGIGDYFKIFQRPYEMIVLVFALAAALFLSLAGHRGAQLVYVQGVGPQGNLLMKGPHHHGGSLPTMSEGTGHESQKGHTMDSPTGQPTPEKTPGTDMPAGHSMEDMATGEPPKHAGKESMPGHDMSAMPGTATPRTMPGMNHGQSPAPGNISRNNMPGRDHANMPGMQRQPASPGNRAGTSNMPEMNHAKMTQPGTPNNTEMNHGNMPMPTPNQKTGNKPPMDHGNMPAAGSTGQTGNMPGMNHENGTGTMDKMNSRTKTDLNGRPLIDPSQPYDNNPAWEQKKARKKQ